MKENKITLKKENLEDFENLLKHDGIIDGIVATVRVDEITDILENLKSSLLNSKSIFYNAIHNPIVSKYDVTKDILNISKNLDHNKTDLLLSLTEDEAIDESYVKIIVIISGISK